MSCLNNAPKGRVAATIFIFLEVMGKKPAPTPLKATKEWINSMPAYEYIKDTDDVRPNELERRAQKKAN